MRMRNFTRFRLALAICLMENKLNGGAAGCAMSAMTVMTVIANFTQSWNLFICIHL